MWDPEFFTLVSDDGELEKCSELIPGGYLRTWAGFALKLGNGKISRVEADYREEKICDLKQRIHCTYFQAGICIAEYSQSDFLIIDPYQLKSYPSTNRKFVREQLYQILEPSFCGLSLPDRDLFQLMGRQAFGCFLREREI